MKQTTDDPSDGMPPEGDRLRAAADGVMLFERLIKIIEALAIWFFGDPQWKARTRIDWRKSILFRRPWTPGEEQAMRRAAKKEIDREYEDNENK